MKTKYMLISTAITIGLLFLFSTTAAGQVTTTNMIQMPDLWKAVPKAVDTLDDEATFPLPLVDLMDFTSVEAFNGTERGNDYWQWRLFAISSRISVGPFIFSDYPLNAVGPLKDSMTAGLAFSIRVICTR